ncbi:hypothetical protein V565_198670, partial [Rhizoctonia solani 123E]
MPNTNNRINAKDIILRAEELTQLGTFVAWATQIEPHPYQRPLNREWVEALKDSFMHDLDRSAHPIKAVLKNPMSADKVKQLVNTHSDPGSHPCLPKDLTIQVFDGQHRVAACELLADQTQHWWIVKIFHSTLETDYPAEFIGMIHIANNPVAILETSDALRLQGMYRLRTLWQEGKISKESYMARVSDFVHLDSACRNKSHPWHQLPGGAEGALDRLKQGPEAFGFATPLTKAAGNKWSLGERAFVPTVITSNIVTSKLEMMYLVTQHLIHIVAGQEVLQRYTSNKGLTDEDDHPLGIFNQVLGKRVLNKEGQVGNGALKIIVNIWSECQTLKQGLSDLDIDTPESTTVEDYQHLINTHEPWWKLLSLFKMPLFEQGLGIKLAKQFCFNSQGNVPSQLASMTGTIQPPIMEQPPSRGSIGSSKVGPTQHQSSHQMDSQLMNQVGIDLEHTAPYDGRKSQPDNIHQQKGFSDTATHLIQTSGGRAKNVEKSAGKKRHRSPAAYDADEDCSCDLSKTDVGHICLAKKISRGSGHQTLSTQILTLADRAGAMDREEACSTAELLDALNQVHGVLAVEVNEMLVGMLP